MTPQEARELFSAAYDELLEADEAAAFQRLLHEDAALAREYESFCATLAAVQPQLPASIDTPDLLRGVQKRLRSGSGGRFYGDRFAERSGSGKLQPWTLLLILAAVFALLWFTALALTRVSLTG